MEYLNKYFVLFNLPKYTNMCNVPDFGFYRRINDIEKDKK